MGKAKINFLKLAYKNLGRHKVKTFLTITAIAVGIALFNWMDAWLLGCNLESKRNLINYETGSAKIYAKKYFEKKDELPLYEAFDNYKAIINKLNNLGYNTAPHAVFSGSLISKELELPFIFIGIDPYLEKTVFKYHNFLDTDDSRFVTNGKFEALIGVKGAKDLNVKVGDYVRCSVTIDIKDDLGILHYVHQLIDLKICGIVNSPNPKTNGNIAYLPLDILQGNMGIMLNGRITEICIRKKGAKEHQLPKQDESPQYLKKILGKILTDNLVVVGWQEDAKDYLAMAANDIVSTYIMTSLLFLLGVIGITNTMLMAIFERMKEIGMIRSLGMKNSQVILLFLMEAGLIGLIGSFIGLVIAMPLDIWIIYWGLDYTQIFEKANMNDIGYRIIGVFRGAWNPHTIIISPIVATIIAVLAALWPAVKAVRMPIADTLRFE